MELTWVDFLTGFLLMNAMPHMLFGLIEVRFLSAFGFSRWGNLAYAAVNVLAALLLFNWQHGREALFNQGIVMGAVAVLFIYLVTGRFFFKLFQQVEKKTAPHSG